MWLIKRKFFLFSPIIYGYIKTARDSYYHLLTDLVSMRSSICVNIIQIKYTFYIKRNVTSTLRKR